MKKIKAFLTALVFLVLTVILVHFSVDFNVKHSGDGMGTWINAYKDLSYKAIDKNLDNNTYMMIGSSEFQHGMDTPYHPTQVFRDMGMDVMCVGSAYNQCLPHAILMGAVGPQLQTKKVVLILSPAWFMKSGLKKEAFGIRFSETQYMAMLRNRKLSSDLKRDIAKRSEYLLGKDDSKQSIVKRYDRIFLKGRANPMDKAYFLLRKQLLDEREAVNIFTVWKFKGERKYKEQKKNMSGKVSDWEKLKKEADEEYSKRSTNNEFHMDNTLYTTRVKPVLKKKKGFQKNAKFPPDSPEYGDLDLFLRVCEEQGIKVELILLPVNGYWFDYTGLTKEKRDELPKLIEKNIRKYKNVKFVSFMDEDYNDGFLEDSYHPAGKGWTEINEEAYRFFSKG